MTQIFEPSLLREYRATVIGGMRSVVLPATTLPARIIAYHLGLTDRSGALTDASPGKLIRSSLCLWASAACGGDADAALQVAVGIELLHNFTLIHDDIQDGDRLRRDRETAWAIWGLGQGVNAGDALHSLGMSVLVNGASDAERSLRIHTLITAAILEVVNGQSLDLELEGRPDTTQRRYLRLAFSKTGALLGAAMEAGAVSAGAPDRIARAFRHAGRRLGVALQLRDDWLGTWGDPVVTGKSSESDLQRRKATYPVVAAYAALDDGQRAQLLSLFGAQAGDPRGRIREILQAAGADEATRALAARYATRALASIAACGVAAPSLQKFEEITQYIAQRDR